MDGGSRRRTQGWQRRQVILAYLEGCRDGPRLRRALLAARAAAKPVVAEGGRYGAIALFTAAGAVSPVFWPLMQRAARVVSGQPGIATAISGIVTEEQRRELMTLGCLVFEEPTHAIEAISNLNRFVRVLADARTPPVAKQLDVKLLPAGALNEAESLAFLEPAGVRAAPYVVAISADEAAAAAGRFNTPLALKVLSHDFMHKSDVGFAHFNNYGSTIETPNLNRLAAGGLRFTNFHTTALCSPTRACMLTGRNHHAVGMRAISNFDPGFPNMRGAIPRSAATLAEVLREHGFGTYMVGKWHLAPMHETGPAGPFHNWPIARGFDRFYGFLQGETDQFWSELVHDQHYIDPPATPQAGYHLTEDLIDHAIGYARDHLSAAPDRPSFSYLAFGACHAPHQAPQHFLDKYCSKFDAGWDLFRDHWFARQKSWASCRRTPHCRRATPASKRGPS